LIPEFVKKPQPGVLGIGFQKHHVHTQAVIVRKQSSSETT